MMVVLWFVLCCSWLICDSSVLWCFLSVISVVCCVDRLVVR